MRRLIQIFAAVHRRSSFSRRGPNIKQTMGRVDKRDINTKNNDLLRLGKSENRNLDHNVTMCDFSAVNRITCRPWLTTTQWLRWLVWFFANRVCSGVHFVQGPTKIASFTKDRNIVNINKRASNLFHLALICIYYVIGVASIAVLYEFYYTDKILDIDRYTISFCIVCLYLVYGFILVWRELSIKWIGFSRLPKRPSQW